MINISIESFKLVLNEINKIDNKNSFIIIREDALLSKGASNEGMASQDHHLHLCDTDTENTSLLLNNSNISLLFPPDTLMVITYFTRAEMQGFRIVLTWVSVSCRGSDTRAPCSVSLCECAFSSLLGRVLFCPRVLCCMQFVFLSAACIHVMSCAVWHAARVFHWLRVFMLSCLVWTRGLWVFSLAACSCPVLHMAGDLFCLPRACVFALCEHMAFVLVFCVPCALMSIVLTPPILFPDYWLICPTCVSRYPPHLLPL